jgi:hypothetical protein
MMDYISHQNYIKMPKIAKISFLWRSKIAFLGNSKKGNFDGLHKQVM